VKTKTVLKTVLAIFIFSTNSILAYADCTSDIQALASRMTSKKNQNQSAQDTESLRTAFTLLTDAKARCNSGDTVGANSVIDQLKELLTRLGR
jgi:hypothetical protein